MSKYQDLDIDHKREFLVNQSALGLAICALSKATGKSLHDCGMQIWKEAYIHVTNLSILDVETLVAHLENAHRPFEQAGSMVWGDLKIENQHNN